MGLSLVSHFLPKGSEWPHLIEARAYRFQLLFSEWIPFRLKFPLLAVEWPVESNEAKERERYNEIVEDELFRRYPLVAHV